MDYKLYLKDNLKIKEIKPVVGIRTVEILHLKFFEEFLKNYKLLKENKNNFIALLLSGLFLHLTLESYVVWIIRWLLENVNRRENRRFVRVWENHFEKHVNLSIKFQFLSEVFLSEEDSIEINEVRDFIEKLSKLRNKIVHGHEFSITSWSDGRIKKSPFAELLTLKRLEENYKEFINCLDKITTLIKGIDIGEITSGLTKEKIANYLAFM